MKKKWIKHICYFFSFVFLLSYSNANSQAIDSLLNSYSDKYEPERIHLHFDKTTYSQGETIWFKAYIMTGAAAASASRNLYVDWADHEGKVLAHQMYPIGNGGTSRGQLELPKDYSSNMVQVHAYTNWMLNFDSALLYQKSIRIIQNKKNTEAIPTAALAPSLQFLPEGGDAIMGIVNKIAFIANDQWGRPINVSGELQNDKGETITEIKAQHDGMGYFKMIPSADEKYIAKWKDEQGNEYKTPLPPAKASGVVLNVVDNAGSKNYIIQRTEDVAENLKQIHVVATMQEKMVYMATVNLTNKTSVSSAIPLAGLSAGGMVITLFNADWQPIAERVSFVDNLAESVFETKLDFTKPNFAKRGLNEFQIDIPDSLASNLSIAITDARLIRDNTDNILSRLLLTGDIRGTVFNPEYYFSDTSKLIRQQLDLVMLTHGWRRFNWENISHKKDPGFKNEKETDYYILYGKVSGASATRLKNAGDLFLIVANKDGKTQNHFVPMNPNGSFGKQNLLLFDSTKVFYKFSNKAGMEETIKFELYNPITIVTPTFKTFKIESIASASKSNSSDLAGDYFFMDRAATARAHELPPVVVTTKPKTALEKLDDKYVVNEMFKGSGAMKNYTLDVEHDKTSNTYQNVFGYMQARVAGLIVTGTLATVGGDGQVYLSRDPNITYFIDEMKSDITSMASLSMNDVAAVKVYYAPFVGADLNGSAINVYTKKWDPSAPSEKMPYVLTQGYTTLKEFYLPNYEGKDSSNNHEDIRPTIYWNPMVVTNTQNHSMRIKFYNNDVTESFRVIIEGINHEGKLTRVEKIIK